MDFDNRLRLHNPANGVSDNAWIDGDDEPWYLDDEDNQVDEVIRAVVSPRRRRSMPRCKQTWHSDSSEPDIGAAPEEVDIEQLLAESLELSPILERVDYQGFSARNMHSQPLHTGAASQLHTLGDDVMIQRRYDSRRSVDLASQFKERFEQDQLLIEVFIFGAPIICWGPTQEHSRKGFSHSQTLPEFPKCEVPGSPPDIRSSLRVQVLTSRSRNRTKSQDSGIQPSFILLADPFMCFCHKRSISPRTKFRLGCSQCTLEFNSSRNKLLLIADTV
ncbi:hypothetical protein CAPTEDRAFT_218129 [Capitella teleta]|uniref:Uncharacterized protein n=1 Tax=Capitella teleta TaxID=283909 RepID=R7U6S9_CAPTE|nr:hypothetical protein CAPTEDRAFT_218129 [Capitella teleta]|eukprot:ELU02070.1 hypothetical protein CAPTEDRAFT_218129 [Capitella teleta]